MKRFYKGKIFCHLITDLFYVALIALGFIDILFIENDLGDTVGIRSSLIPYYIAGCALIYIAFIAYRVLYIRLSGYELLENEIVSHRGVIFRKKSRLEYSKINSINKRQNIIERLFGVCVLTVDSGSANTASTAEILVIEQKEEAERIMQLLGSLKDKSAPVSSFCKENEEKTPLSESYYSFRTGAKLIFSLLNLVTALFYLVIAAVLLTASVYALSLLKLVSVSGIYAYLLQAIFGFFILLIAVSAISFGISVIYSFINYYDFRVLKNGDSINVGYGLIVRHENSFKISKIKAIKVHQGIIKRIFGFASIHIEVIGYTAESGGQDKGESIGVLVPLCKLSELNAILAELLPEYKIGERGERAKAYFPFISWFSLIFTLVSLAVSGVVFPILVCLSLGATAIKATAFAFALGYITVLSIALINAALKYNNSSISVNGSKITVCGGGFVRQITVFDSKNLVAVERVSTPMRERLGISSFVLHIRANAETNEIRLDIRDSKIEEDLVSLLRI